MDPTVGGGLARPAPPALAQPSAAPPRPPRRGGGGGGSGGSSGGRRGGSGCSAAASGVAGAGALEQPLLHQLPASNASRARRCHGTGAGALASAPKGGPPAAEARAGVAATAPARRRRMAARASLSDDFSDEAANRRRLMLRYARECEPEEVQAFVESAPPSVVAAMRHTVANIVGTLPSNFFDVKVSTVADSLAQLFYTMAMTGYLFSSAQYRMELRATLDAISGTPRSGSSTGDSGSGSDDGGAPEAQRALRSVWASSGSSGGSRSGSGSDCDAPSLPSSASDSGDSVDGGNGEVTSLVRAAVADAGAATVALFRDDAEYAPGAQKRGIAGEVLRWHLEEGLVTMPAGEYIERLEAQNAALRDALARGAPRHLPPPPAAPRPRVAASRYGSPAAADGPDVYGMPTPATAGTTAAAAAAAAAAAGGSGELLEYLRGLPADSLRELTSGASPEALDAIDAFVGRLMGTSDKSQLKEMSSEFSASELSKVLIWLLVVGYALRTAEVKLEALKVQGGGDGMGRGGSGIDSSGGVLGLGGARSKNGKGGNKPNWGSGFGGWRRFLPGGQA